MAKKRPPGWKKHQEKKREAKYGPRLTYEQVFAQVLEGETNPELVALLERMEQHPENFGGWGYFDSEGNEHEDLSFLNRKP